MRPPRPKASAPRAQCLGPQAFGSDAPALAPGEAPFSDPGRPLSCFGTPPLLLRDVRLLRSGTPRFEAPPFSRPRSGAPLNDSGRPHPKRPLPTSRRPSRRSPFSRFGGLSLPASGSPPRGSLPTQEAHLSTPAPTWESHLLTAALNLEGTSRIVRKTGQKTRLFVQSGDSGRFPRPSRHVPQFRHCISPVHHCIYSGYI